MTQSKKILVESATDDCRYENPRSLRTLDSYLKGEARDVALSCYFRASSKHLDDPASLLEKIVAYEARVTSFYYINL